MKRGAHTTPHIDRRAWLAAAAAGLVAGAAGSACAPRPAGATLDVRDPFAALEAALGGRVGVCAFDTGSGARLEHRADERFVMCSTFKCALVACVLAASERGELALAQRVPFTEADVLEYAPTTRAHLAEGALDLAALCEAAITVSDNTAANLLLRLVGGPAGLTGFLRACGDGVSRLDRDEPMLNQNRAGDVRDTTSPRAMAHTLERLVLGDVLGADARTRLAGWLGACATGKKRLRAGLPAAWRAGDKTGTGPRGATNDIAVAWPPGRAPIVVAAYLSDSDAGPDALEAAHKGIGEIVAGTFG